MLFTVLRILALMVCLTGYCVFLRGKGLPMAFAPVTALCAIGSILFVAGILNLLPHAAVLLFLGGIFLFLRCRPWKKETLSRQDLLCLGIFAALCGLFWLRIRGEYPLHYDAFSHWMTVIHDTLKNHRFPNFASTLISFQGYQTGGAGLAYFLCGILGSKADDVILLTQAIPIAAGLCVFLEFLKRPSVSGILVVLLGSVYCLVASPTDNLSICEPLPDTLISVLSIAALAIIVRFRDDTAKAVWWSLPIQIFLVAVKNSGVFMLIFNSLLLAWYIRRQNSKSFLSNAWKPLLIHCGIPFGVSFLWNRHVAYVFQYGTLSKHSLSLDYYRGTVGAKSIQQLLDTLRIYLARFFSPNPSWLLLLVCILLFGGAYLYSRKVLKQNGKSALQTLAAVIAAYAAFMIGLAGMYLMSMGYEEATTLGGYDRYEETVIVYLIGAIVIWALEFFATLPGKSPVPKVLCIAAVAVILLTQTVRIPVLFQKANAYEGSSRQKLEQLRDSYAIPEGASCLIYGEGIEGDLGYHNCLGSYIFWSTDIKTCPSSDDRLASLAADCDYLILLSTDEHTDRFLTENGLTPGEAVYALKLSE